ncbi:hypothetical protein AF381_24300 [Salmonella enterica subsp. enterica serovar Typhimurium]|nr:hypothetical protein AF381_24300 [Salmonella enterica subsp. enterica serovar Typhimurium]
MFKRLFDDRRIVRIEKHFALTFIQIRLVFGTGRFFIPVGVVEQNAKITNAPTQVSEQTVGWPESIRG